MRHEKIIKREDGSRVKITMSVYVPYYINILEKVRYDAIVEVSPKGKRSFTQMGSEGAAHQRKYSRQKLNCGIN
jgi:hypothetical protein